MPRAAAALAIEPPKFAAEQLIQANGSDLRVVNYSVPEVADGDADLADLLGRFPLYPELDLDVLQEAFG